MRDAEASVRGPGLVVIGLPAGAEQAATVDRFRARGYAVVAFEPDAACDVDAALAALALHVEGLRTQLPAGGRVAVAGYGRAGVLAFLAVTRLGVDGAAVFRGSGIGAYLAESKFARVPMSMHFDDADANVPLVEVRKIKGALEGIGIIEIYRYERWDDAAAAHAEQRACEVLDGLRAV